MADYKTLPNLSELDAGIDVFEFNVLILPRELEEKTQGGIYLADTSRDREDEAGVEGLIVGMGEFAFSWDGDDGNLVKWRDAPQIGDVVMFARYAGGRNFEGSDGRKYRIMKDKEVLGVRRTSKKPEDLYKHTELKIGIDKPSEYKEAADA